MIISPPQVQHPFAQHGLQLHRYATSPELCDRHSCSAVDSLGRLVYVAAGPRTDFVIIIFPTSGAALRFRTVATMRSERRSNAVLVYLKSATVRLAIVRRIFHA